MILSRRNLIRSVPLAIGCGLLNRPVTAALEPIRRAGGPRLKVALNAYSFSKLLNDHAKGRGKGVSLLDLVDFCAKHEIDGLDATGYFFPGYPKAPADAEIFALKRRAFDSGVGISGTGVRNNFTVPDKDQRAADVRHIKEWIEVAAKLGAPVIRVFADTQMKAQTWETVARGFTREQVAQWIAADLRSCADHAAKFGVIVGLQNHGDFQRTAADQLDLLGRVDSPWCRAIVDTGYYKTPDPYQDMAQAAPFAVNWQIKQSPFGADSEVKTDLKRLIGIVRAAGYRGYLPVETLSVAGREYDPFRIVPQFIADLKQAIAQAD